MYFLSKELQSICDLVAFTLKTAPKLGVSLLLEGPPGSGKTAFSRELCRQLSGEYHQYSTHSDDSNGDLLYQIDVGGVLKKTNAWVPGPVWNAFVRSQSGSVQVILVDELDKNRTGQLDALLLGLMEDHTFLSPEGEAQTIVGDLSNVVWVLTSNKRRVLPEELLRRSKRVPVPFPGKEVQEKIIRDQIGELVSGGRYSGLINLIIKLGESIGAIDETQRPSPKEMARLVVDCVGLHQMKAEKSLFQFNGAGYLTKNNSEVLERLKFDWAAGLKTEASRP